MDDKNLRAKQSCALALYAFLGGRLIYSDSVVIHWRERVGLTRETLHIPQKFIGVCQTDYLGAMILCREADRIGWGEELTRFRLTPQHFRQTLLDFPPHALRKVLLAETMLALTEGKGLPITPHSLQEAVGFGLAPYEIHLSELLDLKELSREEEDWLCGFARRLRPLSMIQRVAEVYAYLSRSPTNPLPFPTTFPGHLSLDLSLLE